MKQPRHYLFEIPGAALRWVGNSRTPQPLGQRLGMFIAAVVLPGYSLVKLASGSSRSVGRTVSSAPPGGRARDAQLHSL